MGLDNPKVGAGYVPAYQVSALPWCTSSNAVSGTVTQLNFPFITSFIAIKNTAPSGNLIWGFTYSGTLGSNFSSLTPSSSFGADFRVKSLFITANSGTIPYEVIVGLTSINYWEMPTLTGSLTASSNSFGYSSGLG